MRDLKHWDPENQEFWEKEGKKVASRNLWISIPALLCGFAVWMYWSIITVQMLNLGFPYTTTELFTLTAIAGLTGATLRIPSSFLVRICGGKYTLFLTTSMLMIPAFGTGWALQSHDTPLWVFQLMALLSGIGGGNFASSMANITSFYPRKKQGLALGLNAGLGNFGVTTMQLLLPLIMTFGAFTWLGAGDPMILQKTSGSLIGSIPAGTETWIQNTGYVWLVLLIPLAFATWFGMNNINTQDVTPKLPKPATAFSIIIAMHIIALGVSAVGLWLMLPATENGSGLGVPKEIVMGVVLGATVVLLKAIPGGVGETLDRQYKIFDNKHTWVMSILYVMTFGSFIGFSAAFPLSIQVIFGSSHVLVDGVWTHDTVNPNAPSALMFAWIAPFIGALIRPVGGWLADKFGGSWVTHACAFVMVICAFGAGYYMKEAYHSATPEQYFIPFFLLFLGLFAASGIGNGSTFRSIAIIFPKEQAGAVLGWTSAVAAYGAFYIPSVIGERIQAGEPGKAMVGFALFYGICMGLNWFYYLRKSGEFYNP